MSQPGALERFGPRIVLFCLAVAAIGLVVVRACTQSITIDEANTVIDFVASTPGAQWYPSSGNHVLNSAVEKLVTSIFGISEVTVRAPAILGAIVYICSALCFCLLVTSRTLLRLALFFCLVYNPLVLDFLVAARGYSLAIGFLFAALTLVASAVLGGAGKSFQLQARLASFFVALSFAANFSFAYVDAVVLLVFFLWASATPLRSKLGFVRLAECCFAPAIVTAVLLCGPTVWDFPKSQLYFGSHSLIEMWQSVIAATFDDLNPNMVNRWAAAALGELRDLLPIAGVAALLALMIGIENHRWRSHKPKSDSSNSDSLVTLLRLLTVIGVFAFLLHWIAFHAAHIPLPSGRTALPFVLLWTLIFGVALSVESPSALQVRIRAGGFGVLILIAAYFAGCLRLGYFREWKFDADSKQLYWVVSDLHARCGTTSFGIDWRYSSPLDFYRLAYHNTSIPSFEPEESGKIPPGRSAYALFYPTSEDFIQQQHLQVIYHNEQTASAVAIRACAANSAQ